MLSSLGYIKEISTDLIIIFIQKNLSWPITGFKTLSTLCLRISRMSLLTEKDGVALFEERELEPVNRLNLLCSQTESKPFNNSSVFMRISDNYSNLNSI